MKFDDTDYMIFRKIQLEEEKSPLLTKIEQMFYSKLSEFQKNPNNMTEKEIQQYFTKSVKDLLKKGLEIRFDDEVKSGFQIGPKNGSYKISFTEEDFINFFKQYLRPRLIKLLFAEE